MRTRSGGNLGFSLLEILIVLAVVGVLIAIGVANMPRDRFAVNQAAEGLARDMQFIRLEAIRRNEFVGLRILPDNNQYLVFQDSNRNFVDDDGVILKTMSFGENGVTISVAAQDSKLFDPRGIPTDFNSLAITLTGSSGSYSRNVCVSGQGKPLITQEAC